MELVSEIIPESWFERTATRVAPGMLGAYLCRRLNGSVQRWKIVEVEAYTQDDPASRSKKGETASNSPMFQNAGLVFVAQQGPHKYLNIVTGKVGKGESVLIRALEPQFPCDAKKLTEASGPTRITRVLQITSELNGEVASPENGIWIEFPSEQPPRSQVVKSKRVGVKKGITLLRRWHLKSSLSVTQNS